MNHLLWIALLLFINPLYAQIKAHQDSDKAFEICSFGSYSFNSISGFGQDNNEFELLPPETSFKETNSVWLSWHGKKTGNLTFDIIPENLDEDLDFILFEKVDHSLVPLRRMTSGLNLNTPTKNSCLGITGLDLESKDLIESDGCIGNSNNYLKYLDIQPDAEYYLLVNNYSENSGFSIDFNGSAELKKIGNCKEGKEKAEPLISPNPASETINIKLANSLVHKNLHITIYSLEGKVLLNTKYEVTNSISIPITTFPNGPYYIKLENKLENYIAIEKFIKG